MPCHTVSPLFIHHAVMHRKAVSARRCPRGQPDAQKARRGCRFAEKNDASSAVPSPMPPSRPRRRADGKVFQGRGQQGKKLRAMRDKRRHPKAKLRVNRGNSSGRCPAYLEQSGQNKAESSAPLPAVLSRPSSPVRKQPQRILQFESILRGWGRAFIKPSPNPFPAKI